MNVGCNVAEKSSRKMRRSNHTEDPQRDSHTNMTSTLKQFKARALARPKVKKAYDALAEEFAFLDEVLEARVESDQIPAPALTSEGSFDGEAPGSDHPCGDCRISDRP